MSATDSVQQSRANAGKYLTFRLGCEEYGLEILRVQEIIGIMAVTRVPRTPRCVRGVINLRGKVIPVIDLRLKFEMEAQADNERTCIIVVQIRREGQLATTGVIVDEVSEVMNLTEDQLAAPPNFSADVDTNFVLGMARIGTKVLTLLDIEQVLSTSDVQVIDPPATAA